MSGSSLLKTLCGMALLAVLSSAPVAGQGRVDRRDAGGFIAAAPETLLPEGTASQVVVLGDPTKPGLYVVRNRFLARSGESPALSRSGSPGHGDPRDVVGPSGPGIGCVRPREDDTDQTRRIRAAPGLGPSLRHGQRRGRDRADIGMGPVKSVQLEPRPAR